MLRKKRSENSQDHPATQSGSYASFRKRKLSRRTKVILGIITLLVLAVPAVLLAKSLYAYKSVVQHHTGVSTEVLTEKDAEFDF
jgi:cobalamin biosynthesis protein CobD/CbiB